MPAQDGRSSCLFCLGRGHLKDKYAISKFLFCKRGPVEQATHLLWAGESALEKKQALLKRKRALCSHGAELGEEPFSSSVLGCGEGKS